MPYQLEQAVNPFLRYPNSNTIEGFNSHLRLSHEPGVGWLVTELNFFQRLYYFLLYPLGVSLREENSTLLQEKFKLTDELDSRTGEVGEKAQALISLFNLTFSKSAPPQAQPLPKPPPGLVAPLAKPPPPTPIRAAASSTANSPVNGISNSGASCWISSSCQVLFRVPEFVDAFKQTPVQRNGESDADFTK